MAVRQERQPHGAGRERCDDELRVQLGEPAHASVEPSYSRTYTYDANGNMLADSSGTEAYEYDALNQPIRFIESYTQDARYLGERPPVSTCDLITTGPPISSAIRRAARCAARRKACARRGATLSFHSSSDATVALRFARLSGTRARPVRGQARVRVKAGQARLRLLGRLRGRSLRPGGYRLILQATDTDGRRSAPVTRPLRIKKG